MPKFIAHCLVGVCIVEAIRPSIRPNHWTPLFLGALIALSPDFDYFIEWLWNPPSQEIHRGFTHSLLFSLFVGLICCLGLKRGQERMAIAYGLAYLSHILLDFLTSTSGGVKLFWFISEKYYHFGLTNIFEIPLGSNIPQWLSWISIELLVFSPIYLLIFIIKRKINQ